MDSNVREKKPFKLLDLDRHCKIGVAVGSLKELIKKARSFYKINDEEELKVVMEDDGTEIVEDEFLMFQMENTKIMVLRSGEEWLPQPQFVDVTDHAQTNTGNDEHNMLPLLQRVAKNPSLILVLSERELEQLIHLDLSQNTGIPSSTLEFLIEKCEEELEKKRKLKNAVDLIHLFEKAKSTSNK